MYSDNNLAELSAKQKNKLQKQDNIIFNRAKKLTEPGSETHNIYSKVSGRGRSNNIERSDSNSQEFKLYSQPTFKRKNQRSKKHTTHVMMQVQSDGDDVFESGEESFHYTSNSSSEQSDTSPKKHDEESVEDESLSFSDNSDNLPYYYSVGHIKDQNGKIVSRESEQEKKLKQLQRLKDFHRILEKYQLCILPNSNHQFEDGMPFFQIFTSDFNPINPKKEKVKNEAQELEKQGRLGLFDTKKSTN